MAKQFNLNVAFSKNEAVFYHLKEVMKAAGWTVPESSDGSTHNASGDEWGSISAVENGSAWIRLQAPDASFEITIQHDSSASQDNSWRIKYSRGAGFTGGSPGVGQTPSASDEAIILGGGTDASPTFANALDATEGDTLHVMADDAAPYTFWAIAYPTGQNPDSFFACDYAAQPNAGDQDPRVFWAGVISSPLNAGDVDAFDAAKAWFDIGGGSEAFDVLGALDYRRNTTRVVPDNLSPNENGADNLLPVPMARDQSAHAGNAFFKGFSQILYWPGTTRSHGDTYDGSNYIRMHDVVVHWDGATAPSL